MPLPMVHLTVAMQFRAVQGAEPTASFLLGSIAPDAIHMRAHAGVQAKHAVHLRTASDSLEHTRLQDLIEQSWKHAPDMQDFAEGYVVHLLTDWHWFTSVHSTFCRTVPGNLSEHAHRTLYYQETDQIDFNLYHNMPWRPKVWTQLAAVKPQDFDPLLTAEEIQKWQHRTLHWFGELKQEPHIIPQYITENAVHAFIHKTVQAVHTQMTAWKKAFDANSAFSEDTAVKRL